VCSAAECTSNAGCCSSMTCEAGVCTPHCTPYGVVQHSADQGCCESTNGGTIRTLNAPGGPVEMCISSNDATYAKTGRWPPPRRPPEVGGNCTGVVGEACRVGTCYSSSKLGGCCCNGLFCGADQTCKCTAREGNPCGPGGCCFEGLVCSDGVCTCRAEGEACLESAGCCNDGLCANGVCVGPVGDTACAGAMQPCAVSAECCGGAAAFCGESNTLDPYVGRRCRAKRQGDDEPVYPGYAKQGIQHGDILPQETFCGDALGYGWDAGTISQPSLRCHLPVQVCTGPRLPGAPPRALRGSRSQWGAKVPFVGRGPRGLTAWGPSIVTRPFFGGGGGAPKKRRWRRATRCALRAACCALRRVGASLLWRGCHHNLERAVRDARPRHRLGHSTALDVALQVDHL